MIVRANKRPQDVYWLQAAVSRHYDTPDSFVRSFFMSCAAAIIKKICERHSADLLIT